MLKKKLCLDVALQNQRLSSMPWIMALCMFLSCTDKPDEKIPGEREVHLPFSCSLSPDGETLLVSASNTDGKYDYGRLLGLRTAAIKSELAVNKSPLSWDKIIANNVLIPEDAGNLAFLDNFVVFASRQYNQLIALPTAANKPLCNAPFMRAQDCPQASSLDLLENDPYAVAGLASGSDYDTVLVSYLSSDRVDVVRISQGMKQEKSFFINEWLQKKLDKKALRKRRIITKKIAVSFKNDLNRSKTYLLVEAHPQKSSTTARAKGLYVIALTTKDILDNQTIDDAQIELWNLSDKYSIASALDFYLDETHHHAYVLGHIPESLFKIDLSKNELIDTAIMCTGATSFAVSQSENLIVVPCFSDSRIAAYSMSPLRHKTTSAFTKKGPSSCAIDKARQLIYCTSYFEGTLQIFDYQLGNLGYVFPKAPSHQIGL